MVLFFPKSNRTYENEFLYFEDCPCSLNFPGRDRLDKQSLDYESIAA